MIKKPLAIIFFFTVSVSAAADVGNGAERFYIVDGVHKLLKRDDLPTNTVPWKLAGSDEADTEFDGEVVVFTHGCDFYDFEYSLYKPSRVGEVISVRAQPGEFCDLRDLVFYRPTLIKVKLWDGVGYLLESALLIFDENDKPYVAGVDLPASWGWNHLLEPYPVNKESRFCRSKESLSPRVLKAMAMSKYIAEFDDEICHSYALSIDKLWERSLIGRSAVNQTQAKKKPGRYP